MVFDEQINEHIDELKEIAAFLKEKKRIVNLKMSSFNTKRVDIKLLLSQVKEDYVAFESKSRTLLYVVMALSSVYFIIGLIVASKGMFMLGLGICGFGGFLFLTFYIYMESYIRLLNKKIKTVNESLDEYIKSSLEADKNKVKSRK